MFHMVILEYHNEYDGEYVTDEVCGVFTSFEDAQKAVPEKVVWERENPKANFMEAASTKDRTGRWVIYTLRIGEFYAPGHYHGD